MTPPTTPEAGTRISVLEVSPAQRRWAMLGVLLGVLMATIDMSIVNLSLPTLTQSFHTDFATIQWVPLSYILVVSSLMLVAARLGDMLGVKKPYLTGLVIFTVASLLCGLATSAAWLIAARAMQGLGAALMQSLGAAIVTMINPASQRGRSLGMVGAAVSLGLALGPALGGLLIGLFGWRSVFLINLPLGAVAMLALARGLPSAGSPGPRQTFDLAGAMALMASLACYGLGMTMGQRLGFGHALTLGLLAAGGLGMAAFIRLEKTQAQPMVDLSLFSDRMLALNLLMGLLCFVQLGGGFVLPFYLELALGCSAQQTGLLMMTVPVCMGLLAPWAGRLSDRYGTRGISLLGLIIIAGGAWGMTGLKADTTAWDYVLRLAPLGLGLGLFQSPNNSSIMGRAPAQRMGVASGLLSLARTLGNSSGLPLMGAVFAASVAGAAQMPSPGFLHTASKEALVAGIQAVYQVAFGLALACVALAGLAWRWEKSAVIPPRQERA